MADYEVRGVDKLVVLSRALKQLGDKDLMREVTKGITRSVKPLKANVKSSTGRFLGNRGGLAERAARTSLPHRSRKTGQRAGVRIEAKPSHRTLRDPLRADRGRINHPVFGMAASRAPWVLQDVTPGWFSRPLEDGAPMVRREIVKVLDDVAEKFVRKIT